MSAIGFFEVSPAISPQSHIRCSVLREGPRRRPSTTQEEGEKQTLTARYDEDTGASKVTFTDSADFCAGP